MKIELLKSSDDNLTTSRDVNTKESEVIIIELVRDLWDKPGSIYGNPILKKNQLYYLSWERFRAKN